MSRRARIQVKPNVGRKPPAISIKKAAPIEAVEVSQSVVSAIADTSKTVAEFPIPTEVRNKEDASKPSQQLDSSQRSGVQLSESASESCLLTEAPDDTGSTIPAGEVCVVEEISAVDSINSRTASVSEPSLTEVTGLSASSDVQQDARDLNSEQSERDVSSSGTVTVPETILIPGKSQQESQPQSSTSSAILAEENLAGKRPPEAEVTQDQQQLKEQEQDTQQTPSSPVALNSDTEPTDGMDDSSQETGAEETRENDDFLTPSASNTPHLSAILNSPAKRIRIRPNLTPHPSPAKGVSRSEAPVVNTAESAWIAAETILYNPSAPKIDLRVGKRKFTGKEELDPASFTMKDLIQWNPKNDTRLKSSEEDEKPKKKRGRKPLRVQFDDVDESQPSTSKAATSRFDSIKGANSKSTDSNEGSANAAPTPRVKVAADGTLILDSESLVINRAETVASSDVRRVYEGGLGGHRRLTSHSFRKRIQPRTRVWKREETDRFYILLSATGTDFSIMKEFFPSRSRIELKNKFVRESKLYPTKVGRAMTNTNPLNPALYELIPQVEEKKRALKRQRMSEHVNKALLGKEEVDEESQMKTLLNDETASSSEDESNPPPVVSQAECERERRIDAFVEKERSRIERMFKKPLSSGRQPKLRSVFSMNDLDSVEKGKGGGKVTDIRLNSIINNVIKKAKQKIGGKLPVQNLPPTAVSQELEEDPPIQQFPAYEPMSEPAQNSESQQLSQDQLGELVRRVQAELVQKDPNKASTSAAQPMSMETLSMPPVPIPDGEGADSGPPGRLLLVHEKSRVPGQPDMVHIYLVSDDAAATSVVESSANSNSEAVTNATSNYPVLEHVATGEEATDLVAHLDYAVQSQEQPISNEQEQPISDEINDVIIGNSDRDAISPPLSNNSNGSLQEVVVLEEENPANQGPESMGHVTLFQPSTSTQQNDEDEEIIVDIDDDDFQQPISYQHSLATPAQATPLQTETTPITSDYRLAELTPAAAYSSHYATTIDHHNTYPPELGIQSPSTPAPPSDEFMNQMLDETITSPYPMIVEKPKKRQSAVTKKEQNTNARIQNILQQYKAHETNTVLQTNEPPEKLSKSDVPVITPTDSTGTVEEAEEIINALILADKQSVVKPTNKRSEMKLTNQKRQSKVKSDTLKTVRQQPTSDEPLLQPVYEQDNSEVEIEFPQFPDEEVVPEHQLGDAECEMDFVDVVTDDSGSCPTPLIPGVAAEALMTDSIDDVVQSVMSQETQRSDESGFVDQEIIECIAAGFYMDL